MEEKEEKDVFGGFHHKFLRHIDKVNTLGKLMDSDVSEHYMDEVDLGVFGAILKETAQKMSNDLGDLEHWYMTKEKASTEDQEPTAEA